MAARLEALEAKISECAPFRLKFGALIFELASLNSNVRALTETMVSTLKQSQDKLQRVSKLDAEETPAANTSIGNTTHHSLPSSLSDPEGAERTRYYTRMNYGSRDKEVVKEPSPRLPNTWRQQLRTMERGGGPRCPAQIAL
jgi:hypothetical protein